MNRASLWRLKWGIALGASLILLVAGSAAAVPLTSGPLVQVSGASPIAACDGDDGNTEGSEFVNSEVEPWLSVDPSDPNVMIIFKAGTVAQTIGSVIVVLPDEAGFSGELLDVFTQILVFDDDGATTPTDAFVVHCHDNCDDSNSWVEETRVTDTSFDSREAPVARGFFLGDYEGLGSNGDAVFPFSPCHTDRTRPASLSEDSSPPTRRRIKGRTGPAHLTRWRPVQSSHEVSPGRDCVANERAAGHRDRLLPHLSRCVAGPRRARQDHRAGERARCSDDTPQ
jgi:hypothetical protein